MCVLAERTSNRDSRHRLWKGLFTGQRHRPHVVNVDSSVIVLSCPPNGFLIKFRIKLVTESGLVQCFLRGFIAQFKVLQTTVSFYYRFSLPTWLMPNWPWYCYSGRIHSYVTSGAVASIQLALRSFSFYAGLLWTITVSGVWDIFLLRWAELIGE